MSNQAPPLFGEDMTREELLIVDYPVDGFEIFGMKQGHLVKCRYIFYSKEEAIEDFLNKYGDNDE